MMAQLNLEACIESFRGLYERTGGDCGGQRSESSKNLST